MRTKIISGLSLVALSAGMVQAGGLEFRYICDVWSGATAYLQNKLKIWAVKLAMAQKENRFVTNQLLNLRSDVGVVGVVSSNSVGAALVRSR